MLFITKHSKKRHEQRAHNRPFKVSYQIILISMYMYFIPWEKWYKLSLMDGSPFGLKLGFQEFNCLRKEILSKICLFSQ